MPATIGAGDKSKPGAKHSLGGSYISGRKPSTWAIIYICTGYIHRKLNKKNRIARTEPGTSIQSVGTPRGGLTH